MRGKTGYYYPMTIKRMLITVLNMFAGCVVYKYDSNGEIIDEVDVELMSGPAQTKHRARTNEEQQQFTPQFPRIEVHTEGMNINESRIVSPNTERFWNDVFVEKTIKDHNNEILLSLNGLMKDFMPIPYDYIYTVNVFTEYIDHMAQILENIFPYFGPSNTTIRVKEFSFLNIERDLKVTLGNPAIQIDSTEIAPGELRKVSCNFTITIEGYMYRKVESSKIISSAVVKLFDAANSEMSDQTYGSILGD